MKTTTIAEQYQAICEALGFSVLEDEVAHAGQKTFIDGDKKANIIFTMSDRNDRVSAISKEAAEIIWDSIFLTGTTCKRRSDKYEIAKSKLGLDRTISITHLTIASIIAIKTFNTNDNRPKCIAYLVSKVLAWIDGDM